MQKWTTRQEPYVQIFCFPNWALFSGLAISLILDLETNLVSNSVSFDVPAGRVVSGGRGKHPVYKTVRKKILKISLAPTDFQREELIRMWNPSSSFLLFPFFFFPQEESPMCHVPCNTGYIHHRWPGSFVLVVYSLSTCIVFSSLKYSTLMRNVSVQMHAVSSWKMLW